MDLAHDALLLQIAVAARQFFEIYVVSVELSQSSQG
jgi:hypothetical protein